MPPRSPLILGFFALLGFLLAVALEPFPSAISCSEKPDSRPTSRPTSQAASRPSARTLALERAYTLMRRHGCLLCHSTDGSDGEGPSLKGIYGGLATLADGSKRRRDDGYFRQKILQSESLELAGDRNVMPAYLGSLSSRDLDDIIEYIRSLR